jgi:hypothetical protein
MKSSTISSHSNILQLGTAARSCILQGGRGNVLAVVSHAIYLLTESNELFWITTEDAPMHRRSLQLFAPLPGISTGTRFHMQDHRLEFDASVALDMENASVWSALHMDPEHLIDFTSLFERMQFLFSLLDHAQAKGFGLFIPQLLSLSRGKTTDLLPETTDPVLRFAKPLVFEMARACLVGGSTLISKNAGALVGLGAGLTPSGDDFLGGLLFSLHILQTAYPGLFHTPLILPIETYRLRTHLISFTLLNDHASGYSIAPMHFILNGLLSGEPLEGIYPFINRLTGIGHSTGWDLLTGMLTGMLITAPENPLILSRTRHNLEA